MSITVRTRKLLWGLSGNRCAICKGELVLAGTQAEDRVIVGEECHIVSGRPNGPRADPSLPAQALDRYDNLMLLCPIHHGIVDSEPEVYTATKLKRIKTEHEKWVAEVCGTSPPDKGAPIEDRYVEFIVRHTSHWNIPHFSRTLELDHIYISEIIKEYLNKVIVSLEEALTARTPVYQDGVLLASILGGDFDLPDALSHVLVLGEPGFGKTTLMFRWAHQVARNWYESGEGPFPIWIPFKDWVALTPAQSPPLQLAVAAATKSAAFPKEGLSNALATIMQEGQAIVFLDGFDEMFQMQRQMIRTVFRACQDAFPRARFIVTSRKAAYTHPPPGYKVFEILAFSNAQIEQFVGRYFSENTDSKNRFLEELSSNERFSHLARTPLFLTIMCLVFEEHGHLPANETDLYDLCLKQLIEYIPADKGIVGLDRKAIALEPQECPNTDEVLGVLRAIAQESFLQEKDPMPRAAVLEVARKALEAIGSSKNAPDVVDFIETNTELITKTDRALS